MALYTVVITGGGTPEVYGGLVACDAYLAGGEGSAYDKWRALVTANNTEKRSRALLTATRFLDSMSWQGARTSPAVDGTTLQWPRAGLIDREGADLDDQIVPIEVIEAAFELAAMIAVDPSIVDAADQSSNIQSLQAGSASISYFSPTSIANGTARTLAAKIDRLVGRWLGGGAQSSGGSIRGGEWHGERCGSYMDRYRQYRRDEEF